MAASSKRRRVKLPSGRAVSLRDISADPGGPWEAKAVGSHYIVQRTRGDGREEAVTGPSTLAISLDSVDAAALVEVLNGG